MRPRALHYQVFSVLAFFAIPMLLATAAAVASVRSNLVSYRYAGVVEDARGIPTHTVRKGGGITFSFFDALSQGRRSQPYRLCVGRPGKPAVHCWNRTARYGVGKVGFSFTLPSGIPVGELLARWSVTGKTVATWAFLYVRSD